MKLTKKEISLLGKYWRDKRIMAGISQRELALLMKYESPQFISNWERGISEVPIYSLKKLTRLLKVDSSEVVETYSRICRKAVEDSLNLKESA